MAHAIALNFEDGVTRLIEARPGETVAEAAYRLGINIPLDCRDGACGTCKCRIASGSFESGDYLEDALGPEEAAEGYALACQARPTGDLVVEVAASSAACKTRPQSVTATLAKVARLSPSTLAFELDVAGAFGFLPGQYVNLTVPGTRETRSYSFASAPGTDRLAFLIRDIPGGLMSGTLRGAAAGLALEFTGPSGSFYLRDVKRPLLFLAGGTGLAPFLSMLRHLKAKGTGGHPVHLVYGVTRDADLVEVDTLEALARDIPGFTFATVVADAQSPHPRTGYVTDHLPAAALHGGDVDIYLCGPPPMVDAVRGWLHAQGVTPAGFHTEKFAVSGTAAVPLKRAG
ncbi:benzoate 1,2-dioxygenase electron transfer component BenC [Azorhizobium doebereinerae]|uniref:benzoate 1,2-dioxygenase electron transfer component BenC n=1 Tax=Azorhizobium doebereinerae TaxID=281091 RepID=UPI000421EAC1|nr:benzoate 1,2-dioxygenase electron transfer component BenC [Azorhizobium doebereinerae]